MLILTAISIALCATALAYLLVNGQDLKAALSFTVVLLVASIPIAIEIVSHHHSVCTTKSRHSTLYAAPSH
jgi:H+-transporting ATPase